MFTKTLITAGLVGLALCTQPVAARPGQSYSFNETGQAEVMQRQVHYADLDPATPKGKARLEARLRAAASAVCGASYGAQPVGEAMEARRCYNKALQSAHRQMADIGNARLVSR